MAHRYGVHGDYLKDGKLDLPELLEVPSADDWEWVRDFIQRRRWQAGRYLSRDGSARVHGP